jgi:hypothetical protein
MPLSDRRSTAGENLPDYATIARALAATRRELAPGHWHKGASAVDALGREREPNDCRSVAWCVHGIMLRHLLDGSNATIRAATHLLHRTASRVSADRHETLFAFNDDPATTFADIDRLVAAARDEAERLAARPRDGMAAKPSPAASSPIEPAGGAGTRA